MGANITNRPVLLLLILFTFGYAAFFSMYTVSRHRAFHSLAFDLGWQHQAMWTLLHTGNPVVTLWVAFNHFGNHFQPLYYLLAPIYALHQDAITLLLLQTVLLASAAIPLYFLALRRISSPWAALAIAGVYLLYPPLHGMNNFDFHGLVLLVPFTFWLLYSLETRSACLFWVFLALGLITREDTAVSLSGIGLYLLLDRERRRLGLAVLGICAAWFVIVQASMSALKGSADLSNYWALTVPERQDFSGVLLTLITNPVFVFRHVFLDPGKLEYLAQILLPVALLPLFTGRALLLLAPGLAIMLLSNTSFNYSIACPYSAHIVPGVFFLTILGIQAVRQRWGTVRLPTIIVPLLMAGLLMDYEFGLVLSKRFPGLVKPTERQHTAYSLFKQVPPDASVATDTRFVPHLSGRHRVSLWQAPRQDAEYLLLDLAPAEPAIDLHEKYSLEGQNPGFLRIQAFALDRLEYGMYGVLRYENGFLLLKKGADIAANEATARSIRVLPDVERPALIDYYRDPALEVDPPRLSASDRLLRHLDMHTSATVLLAAKGDAARRLSYRLLKYLLTRGSSINTLDPGGAYVAVIHHDTVVREAIGNQRPVGIASTSDPALRALFGGLDLSLFSSGAAAGSQVSIRIAGQEEAMNQEGMNVVVLDSFGRVVERAVYATGR